MHIEQRRNHIGTISKLGCGLIRDIHARRGQHVAEHDAQTMTDSLTMRIGGKRTMRGWLAATQIGIIDDVIMHQGAGLKNLYGTRQIK